MVQQLLQWEKRFGQLLLGFLELFVKKSKNENKIRQFHQFQIGIIVKIDLILAIWREEIELFKNKPRDNQLNLKIEQIHLLKTVQ